MTAVLRYLLAAILVCSLAWPLGSEGQEARVNQKKIEREQKKKEKAAMKDYRDALKRHLKRQSKETKAMMRQSRKEAKKTMPVRKK
jgi:hypothetical protein